ncbi:hypothetical protein G3T14_24270 [Methylobacterium sp. BTF04]|uniref:hypothetical protein n=1 Tax=Methylobacterium sp. BTF04 TaxID=2708300 RepID=UPI0013D766E9|nr:hypothetical protein [Methylobacterium sp. BTF04]NEU15143.1 hypothetical protein [Methylobacterium sp. BTF04]
MSQEKKSRKFDSDIPEFIREYAGEGTENISHRDCCWMGKDGGLDDKDFHGISLEVRPLEDAVALAKARGTAGSSSVESICISNKISMPWDARKRGPKEFIDDDMICIIATRFHERFFSNSPRIPELVSVRQHID